MGIKSDQLETLFSEVAAVFGAQREKLCEMDAAMGDGDLGLTMDKGFRALPGMIREARL